MVLGAFAASVLSCGRADRPSSSGSTQPNARPAAATGASIGTTSAQIPVAVPPPNDCDWIPTSDVEAIVGKLAEPPREHDGGCLYTLPVPQNVLDERAKMAKIRASIDKLPGAEPSSPKKEARDETYGFLLEVDVKDNGLAQGVSKSVGSILADWARDDNDTAHTAPSPTPSLDSMRKALGGWDYRGSLAKRLGQLRITLTPIASDFALPREKLDQLAARVRDRIPDRPFPLEGRTSPEELDHDPCALITRQEAEAVLGPMLVPAYRTGNDGPLAYANGPSCGYYTAGHHVLVVTPHWSNGKRELGLNNGIGGLISSVSGDRSAQSADTLEGPWDQASMSLTGQLMVLKGDRLLEISYRTSSTDETGALKLARAALPRLAASKQ